MQTVVSVVPWFDRDTHGFSARAGRTVHVGVVSVGRRAGNGWRGVVHSMSCTVVCGTSLARACMHGNASGALGVHERAAHDQNKGQGMAYRGSRRRAMIGWRGRWGEVLDGEGAASGFLPMPQSKRACSGGIGEREREMVR
jgi:hypothetical protein